MLPTRSPSAATLAALCALAGASLLSACGRDEPAPINPTPAATPAPPTDPNDPLRRRNDPNNMPGSVTPPATIPDTSPSSPSGGAPGSVPGGMGTPAPGSGSGSTTK